MLDTNVKAVKIAVVTVLWTVAAALAVTGTAYGDTRLMFWSVLDALVACVVTSHLVAETAVRNDRAHIEHMIDGLIAGAREKDSEVDRIH